MHVLLGLRVLLHRRRLRPIIAELHVLLGLRVLLHRRRLRPIIAELRVLLGPRVLLLLLLLRRRRLRLNRRRLGPPIAALRVLLGLRVILHRRRLLYRRHLRRHRRRLRLPIAALRVLLGLHVLSFFHLDRDPQERVEEELRSHLQFSLETFLVDIENVGDIDAELDRNHLRGLVVNLREVLDALSVTVIIVLVRHPPILLLLLAVLDLHVHAATRRFFIQ